MQALSQSTPRCGGAERGDGDGVGASRDTALSVTAATLLHPGYKSGQEVATLRGTPCVSQLFWVAKRGGDGVLALSKVGLIISPGSGAKQHPAQTLLDVYSQVNNLFLSF